MPSSVRTVHLRAGSLRAFRLRAVPTAALLWRHCQAGSAQAGAEQEEPYGKCIITYGRLPSPWG
ncbi:MAG TPA: hypothetical protein VGP33_04090 [Chloroflexota bacterium]|jgi:hypothetical protein|nr:hypothetical protein [Chloroflexota bacterium]